VGDVLGIDIAGAFDGWRIGALVGEVDGCDTLGDLVGCFEGAAVGAE